VVWLPGATLSFVGTESRLVLASVGGPVWMRVVLAPAPVGEASSCGGLASGRLAGPERAGRNGSSAPGCVGSCGGRGDAATRLAAATGGLETVCLRYFNVYGPRQDPSSPYSGVLSLFLRAALERHAPTIFGDGEQSRDFTYVENAVQANLVACEAPAASGNVFNIGTGDRYTLNQTLEILRRLSGRNLQAKYEPPREGDIRDSQADISAARQVLGYEPTVRFEEGLERTYEWYREASAKSATK